MSRCGGQYIPESQKLMSFDIMLDKEFLQLKNKDNNNHLLSMMLIKSQDPLVLEKV